MLLVISVQTINYFHWFFFSFFFILSGAKDETDRKHLGWNTYKRQWSSSVLHILGMINELWGRAALVGLEDNFLQWLSAFLRNRRITQNRDQMNNFGSSAYRWIFKLSGTCYSWGEKRGVGCLINNTREKMLYRTACSVVNTCFCRNSFPSWS